MNEYMGMMALQGIINEVYDLSSGHYRQKCRETLDVNGVLHISDFLHPNALRQALSEALATQKDAYYCRDSHNVYLTPKDENLPSQHAYNRQVQSSKGGVADDEIAPDSPLRQLYNDNTFKEFLQYVLGEEALFPYADPLSSINIHYASEGQELGWHFDNSSFAITLLLQRSDSGGEFQYIKDIRFDDKGEENYASVDAVLSGDQAPKVLPMSAGSLVLFRGMKSIHRVSPAMGKQPRIIVVFAYNNAPDIALNENARMTFYGRVS